MVTLQFVHYSEIDGLSSLGRIKKLLNLAKNDKIVLLQGRLKKEEEMELIKTTMEEINSEFQGIELAIIDPARVENGGFAKLKNNMINTLLGNRAGMTVIGSASIVKQIRKDPSKIELFTRNSKKKKSASKKGSKKSKKSKSKNKKRKK